MDVQGAVHAVYDNCQVFLFEQINGFEKFVLGHLQRASGGRKGAAAQPRRRMSSL